MDCRAFASPKGLRPRRRVKPRHDDSLTDASRQGSHPRMIQRLLILALALITTPASAMVGGGGAPAENIARAVVTIIGSRGTFCTGSLIAQDLVLSAAHCVLPGADY